MDLFAYATSYRLFERVHLCGARIGSSILRALKAASDTRFGIHTA
jgi:hypothetical protein